MKKTKLKILFTSLSFFALSATFGQVDTSGAVTTTPADSAVSIPQGSPVATDSTSVNQNVATDSTSTMSADDKAAKKREKAAKKEAKAGEAEAKESK